MTAATLEFPGKRAIEQKDSQIDSQQRLAKVSGLLYLVLFVFGMFAPLVLESLIVSGDASATAEKLQDSLGLFGSSIGAWVLIVAADIAISITLYFLLAPAGKTLAMTASAFRLVYSAVLAAFVLNLVDAFTLLNGADRLAGEGSAEVGLIAASAVDTFNIGFELALVFFGIHLVLLGWLLVRSAYVPKVLGAVLAIAGAGYVINSMLAFFVSAHSETVSIVLLTPALIGELGITAWLLLKGIRAQQTSEIGAK